jgi:hypothetical protein
MNQILRKTCIFFILLFGSIAAMASPSNYLSIVYLNHHSSGLKRRIGSLNIYWSWAMNFPTNNMFVTFRDRGSLVLK